MNVSNTSTNTFDTLEDDMHIKTEIRDSGIAGAGKGRFFKEDCKKGTIVRVQSIHSGFARLQQFRGIEASKYRICY